MDGLRSDAEIMFILTTNRPEALEAALASRPGRVDQAIEFPLPDEEGRVKLIRLYGSGMDLPDGVVAETARKTEDVSAAFIKELMRRTAQFFIERDNATAVETQDVDAALEELVFSGGSLNRQVLGFHASSEA
jgi:ATP-dependent 26S proteasome regulatory subunit